MALTISIVNLGTKICHLNSDKYRDLESFGVLSIYADQFDTGFGERVFNASFFTVYWDQLDELTSMITSRELTVRPQMFEVVSSLQQMKRTIGSRVLVVQN